SRRPCRRRRRRGRPAGVGSSSLVRALVAARPGALAADAAVDEVADRPGAQDHREMVGFREDVRERGDATVMLARMRERREWQGEDGGGDEMAESGWLTHRVAPEGPVFGSV